MPAYYPVRGGIETLLSLFRPRLEQGYGIESVALAPLFNISQPDLGEIDGLRTHLIPVPGLVSEVVSPGVIASYFAIIRRVLEIEKPDVIHLNGPYSLFHTVPKVARSMNIPLIHHLHGELAGEIDSSTLLELSKAEHLVAVSGAVASSIRRYVPDCKPIVIPNGIEPLEISSRDNKVDEFVIVLVGRLDVIKGFDYALRAISLVKKRGIKVRIKIVGIGDVIYIHSLLDRLELSEETFFYGRCRREETLEIMRSSSLLIASSVGIEGFSLVAAEAGGVGIPVVAFKTGGLSETVIDGVTGTLVEARNVNSMADAIERYARDEKLMILHGDNAVKHVRENLSIERFTSRIVDVYQAALARK